MIIVQKVLSADNADVLAASDLETMPSVGALSIFAASTQVDSALTVSGGPLAQVARTYTLPKRTDGSIDMQSDVPLVVPVTQGAKITVNLDIVTAATVYLTAVFQSLSEIR